jgi:hypothetical protein
MVRLPDCKALNHNNKPSTPFRGINKVYTMKMQQLDARHVWDELCTHEDGCWFIPLNLEVIRFGRLPRYGFLHTPLIGIGKFEDHGIMFTRISACTTCSHIEWHLGSYLLTDYVWSGLDEFVGLLDERDKTTVRLKLEKIREYGLSNELMFAGPCI